LLFVKGCINKAAMKSKTFVIALVASVCACSSSQTISPPVQANAQPAAVASPHASVAADAVQFAVIGDFGDAGPAEAAVSKLVHGWQPEFIVTLGDNNYPSGAAQTIDDNIAQYYSDYIAFNPNYRGRYKGQGTQDNRFFPALGNHDWRTADLAPYYEMFGLPGNARYYNFSRGPVEFFILDSDPHEPDGVGVDSKQASWLQAGLASSTAAFKVVVMHHPPYSYAHHGSSKWMQWPYKAWGASIVLAGHDHCYERIEVDGMRYIVNGAGGAHLFDFDKVPRPLNPTLEIGYSKSHGAMHVHADRHSMTLSFFSTENERIDTLTLTR
jgi:hypothetical protein